MPINIYDPDHRRICDPASRTDRRVHNHGFGVFDRYRREIGARICVYTVTARARPDQTDFSRPCEIRVPGELYFYRPHSTRNGEIFGAGQSGAYFATPEERDDAIKAYLRGARKRANELAAKA